MKKNKVTTFICLWLIVHLQVSTFAQARKKIDSAEIFLRSAKDTAYINTLNYLAEALQNHSDSSLHYSTQAAAFGEKNNFKKQLIKTYLITGKVYGFMGDNKQLLTNYNTALKIAQDLKDQKQISACYVAFGDYYFKDGNYPMSMDCYLKSLKIDEATGNKKGAVINYYTIGNIYSARGDIDKSLEYQEKSLKLAEAINDKESIAYCYDNMSPLYMAKGNSALSLECLLKAMKILEELNDKGGLMAAYNNLGVWYQNEHKENEANLYYLKVLKLAEEASSEVGVAISSNNLGETNNKTGNYSKAVDYFNKSIALSKEIRYNELLKNSYKGLAESYVGQKNFQKAYETILLFMQVKDTILNEATNKQMAEVQTKYETEKKELQIASLSKDKQLLTKDKDLNDFKLNRQRILIYSVSFGLILMLTLTFFIFRGYKEKQKANLLLGEKNSLIEEKNKDITDSINYAKRIQRAILTSPSYLKKNLPDHFVLYKPKDIVSGDFYWTYKTSDNNIILATADSTGHGVPGAFMSLIGASKLNEIVIERKIISPDQILNRLRDEIIKALNPEDAEEASQDGMDISICCYDFTNMKLEYAGANNSIYIISNGILKEYKPDKFPVGKYNGELNSFTAQTIALQKGDCIYSFTDGYADQFGGKQGKKFKYKHLQELLLSIHSKPMEQQKQLLNTAIEEWKGILEQVDDILIIGVKA